MRLEGCEQGFHGFRVAHDASYRERCRGGQAARRELFEVIQGAGFVGVQQREVEGSLHGLDEFVRVALLDGDAVGEAEVGEELSCLGGAFREEFQGEQRAAGGFECEAHPDTAEAEAGSDFEDAAGAGQADEEMEELAFEGRDAEEFLAELFESAGGGLELGFGLGVGGWCGSAGLRREGFGAEGEGEGAAGGGGPEEGAAA